MTTTLRAERAALGWADLLCQVNPDGLVRRRALAALERLAGEVIPHLV